LGVGGRRIADPRQPRAKVSETLSKMQNEKKRIVGKWLKWYHSWP
jgi:hypothetical protein